MRGHQTLYTSLFPSSLPEADKEKKGKRNVYIERRHDVMACRYYYHAEIRRIRFDDCLMELSEEFNLSPNVISQCIKKRIDYIKILIKDKTTETDLRKLYPHFNWALK